MAAHTPRSRRWSVLDVSQVVFQVGLAGSLLGIAAVVVVVEAVANCVKAMKPA